MSVFFWSNNYVRNNLFNLFLRHQEFLPSPKKGGDSMKQLAKLNISRSWTFDALKIQQIWEANIRRDTQKGPTETHLDTCRMYSAFAWQSSKSSASNINIINPNDFTTESNAACQYFKISINFTFHETNNHDQHTSCNRSQKVQLFSWQLFKIWWLSLYQMGLLFCLSDDIFSQNRPIYPSIANLSFVCFQIFGKQQHQS